MELTYQTMDVGYFSRCLRQLRAGHGEVLTDAEGLKIAAFPSGELFVGEHEDFRAAAARRNLRIAIALRYDLSRSRRRVGPVGPLLGIPPQENILLGIAAIVEIDARDVAGCVATTTSPAERQLFFRC